MQAPTQQPTNLSLAQSPPSQADAERLQHMKAAWKAYKGDFSKPLKVTQGKIDDNLLSNRCAPIVDKGVSFLFGQTLKVEGTDGNTDIQDTIDGLWGDDDDRMTLLSKAAINGGVCGHAFIKLIPAQGQMQYPRLVVMDPLLVRIITHPDDCELVLAFVIEYPTANGMQKRQIIARVDPDNMAGIAGEYDLDDYWTINTYIRSTVGGAVTSWQPVGEPETWDYPFPPIFHCQNLPNPNEAYGKPDLTPDIIDMNRALNFNQSNTNRIIRFHAHPKTWAKGLRTSQISIGIDDVIVLESKDGEIGTLEMHCDLASSLNFAAVLRADMDEQSRVPAVALGRQADLPKGNISGVALQLLFQPLIEKTTQKQRLYGKMIRENTRAALVIAGKISLADYEDYQIDLHWQNLLPVDDLAAAQTAQILQAIGVSNTTLLQQLGYDPDAEADKSATEDAKKLVQFSRGQGMPPVPPQAHPAPGQPTVVQQDAQEQQKAGVGNE